MNTRVDELWNSLRVSERDDIITRFMKDDFFGIVNEIEWEKILGLAAVEPYNNTKSELIYSSIVLIKKIFWAVLSVKARYYKCPTNDFLCMTDSSLHYLWFKDQILYNHVSFSRKDISNLTVTKPWIWDQIAYKGITKISHDRLSFIIGGKEVVFMCNHYIMFNHKWITPYLLTDTKKIDEIWLLHKWFIEEIKKMDSVFNNSLLQ